MARPASTQHGTTAYARREKCRCEPCCTVMSTYRKRLAYDNDTGKPRTVPAGPVREHVRRLKDAGFSAADIVRATGDKISPSQLRRLEYGDFRTGKAIEFVFRSTAEPIMAVAVRQQHGEFQLAPGFPTTRRLQALFRNGHSIHHIAERMGVTASRIYQLMKSEQIFESTAEKVAEIYDDLAGVQGHDEMARWKGIRRGWAPPMAWDDDAIEDPKGKPDWAHVLCAVPRCTSALSTRGLCRTHHQRLKKLCHRSNTQPTAFRVAVLAMATVPMDSEGLRASLAELKEMGVSPSAAATRLGRGQHYVEKVWSKV